MVTTFLIFIFYWEAWSSSDTYLNGTIFLSSILAFF